MRLALLLTGSREQAEDLSEQGVADMLGCSLSAARSLITRGMETLRTRMRGEDG